MQICWLEFKNDWGRKTRSLNSKNIVRLVKIFKLEECFHWESKHYVSALISSEALNVTLRQTNCDHDELFVVTVKSLQLNLSSSLICLHMRHHLKAVKQHLNSTDKWWVVDLYLNNLFSVTLLMLNSNWCLSTDIHDDAKMAIKNKYFNFRNFCDDNIFQNLQYHQRNNNKQEVSKWITKLSKSKQRNIIQL